MTDETEDHDKGLSHDLPRLLDRRRLFRLAGGVGVAAVAGGTLAACRDDGSGTAGTSSSTPATPATPSSDGPGGPGGMPPVDGPGGEPGGRADVTEGEIPEETAGPFPGDGSNGVNVLSETASSARTSGAASATPPAWPRASRSR